MNYEGRQLILEKKRQEALKKDLDASLELIQVMQKEVMIQITKLVKHKHLLVNLRTKK